MSTGLTPCATCGQYQCVCGNVIRSMHGTSVWEAIELAANRQSYQPEIHESKHPDTVVQDEYTERLETSVGEAREKIQKLEEELRYIYKKLEEGTLHVVYCNDNPDSRVGRVGGICCCTLGKEIKNLRHQLTDAKKEIKKLEFPNMMNPTGFTVTFIKNTIDVQVVLRVGYGMDEQEAFDLAIEMYKSDDESIDDYMDRVKEHLGDRPLAEKWHRRD